MNGAIGRVMRRFCVFLLSVLLTLSMVPASPFDAATALAATSGDVVGLADQNSGSASAVREIILEMMRGAQAARV